MDYSPEPPIRPPDWFADNLPKLQETAVRFTSRSTFDYNCVGLVVGDFRWWHPHAAQAHYWPPGVGRDPRLWAHLYADALATEHFEAIEQVPIYEPQFENVVILHKGGQFTHTSLQVGPNLWKSKLGNFEDLEHPLDAILDGAYGQIFRYMRREARFGNKPMPEEYKLP